MSAFNPEQLGVLRHVQRMTTTELGDRVGLSHNQIVRYEKGLSVPKADVVEALAIVLQADPAFFYHTPPDVVHEWQCHFRTPKGTTERTKKAFAAAATLFGMVVHEIRREVPLYEYDVPSWPAASLDDVERAASETRRHWKLSLTAPLEHIGRLVEKAGVVITTMQADPTGTVDGFSRYGDPADGVSLVVLSETKGSPSRWRFSVAHELGHGVLAHGTESSALDHEQKELQANRFASAFLMPADGFAREFLHANSSLSGLLELKVRWGVSLQAMVVRAHQLGLLNVAEYRERFRQISRKGWRLDEPNEPAAEQPELFAMALDEFTRITGKTLRDVARAVRVRPELVAALTSMELPPLTQSGVTPLFPVGHLRLA
ncbi:XRE family transcriptional regulator [Gemmatimonas sp.]|uniref:XRE family transcriptional regulator n=1 Tax=Gemmatimonas sp. TaxID=1962908 RepID=UPI003F700E3F